MSDRRTKEILQQVQAGTLPVEQAMLQLKLEPFQDLGYAKVDHHRRLRQGVPEVIYGGGKTPEQITGIVSAMREAGQQTILITRLSPEAAAQVEKTHPLTYHSLGRIATIGPSDVPVAEEAAVTAQALGNQVTRLYDVGVAGVHRLLANLEYVMDASVIIAIAGMEGALASVVGGLADCPVIAVPTSVGYGASFHGLSALLSMLNSCASGICVVNIDNGFGAGYLASQINHMEAKHALS